MARRGIRYGSGGWRYRPARAWLGQPGDGVPLRRHRGGGRWQFRWAQLRVLAIAILLAVLAWLQLVGISVAHLLGWG